MPQKLRMSGHLLEAFMPYRKDEARMISVLERALALGCYKNVELPVFQVPSNQDRVRHMLAEQNVTALTYLAPYLNEHALSLCDPDAGARKAAVGLAVQHAASCAAAGFNRFGIPSGPDPGDAKRPAALERFSESAREIAAYCRDLGMDVTVEPLDRYAYKKQLIGPMEEAVDWIRDLRRDCSNIYLHWDSAHEALGGADLLKTLLCAAPFNAQIHLCDAITDPNHPCFGDLHKDVAHAPDWSTEGILTPELGAEILRTASMLDAPAGLSGMVHVSVEVLGHPGDDLWRKESAAREFLLYCAQLAGISFV